jgi:hypothetical protein
VLLFFLQIVNNILAIRDIYETRNRDVDKSSSQVQEITMNPMMNMFDRESDSPCVDEPPVLMPITPKAIRPAPSAPVSVVAMKSEVECETEEVIPSIATSLVEATAPVIENGEILRELEAKALARKEEFALKALAYEEKKRAMEFELAEKTKALAKQGELTKQCMHAIDSKSLKSSIISELTSCASDVGGMMAMLKRAVQSHRKLAKDTEESLRKETVRLGSIRKYTNICCTFFHSLIIPYVLNFD